MSSAKKKSESQQKEEIYELVSMLTAGDLDTSPNSLGDEQNIAAVVVRLREMAENLSGWNVKKEETEERLNSILETIISISSLDFDHKAKLSDQGDIFDAVAVGLNALGEELQTATISRGFLDNILSSMVDSLIVLDKDGTIQIVYQAVLDLLGYTSAELVGNSLEKIVVDDEIQAFTPRALSKVAFIRDKETHFQNKYGLKIPVSYSLSVLRDSRGNFNGAVCVGHNITARIEAENALRESEARYRTLFDQSPFGVLLVDPETTSFIEFNDSMAKMLGYSRSEFGKLNVADIELIENPEDTKQHFEKILREGQDEFESKLRTIKGEIRTVVVNIQVIELAGKKIFLDIIRDVTESKRAEEQIRTSLAEKEVLLREIHHRVKNNLQIISSLLYLQTKRAKDEETIATLQDSQNRVKAMSLIHEKLYQTENLSHINMEEYILSLVQSLFTSFGVTTNTIDLQVLATDVYFGVDLAIPCGVIINELISNALKYAFPNGSKGSIRIEVETSREGGWELKVEDDGIGLPDDLNIERSNSLGLQLVSNLVEQLNGEIIITKEKGGAKFIIKYLPQNGKDTKHA
jgi:PAS domain S-box-containing protein